MKVKTLELTGAALDWAVAKCEGQKPAGSFLDGVVPHPSLLYGYTPSTDWAQGGPILERQRIRLDCPWPNEWRAEHKYQAKVDGFTGWCEGPTPLVAAMRCYVLVAHGPESEIPEELT